MVVRAFLVIEEAMVLIVVTVVAEDICGEGISGDGHGS